MATGREHPSPEAVRRALIAVLCLASIVPGATQGPTDDGARGEDGRVWVFWIFIIAVVVFAWEGVKLSIGSLQRCLFRHRTPVESHARRTVAAQTDQEAPLPLGTSVAGEGLRRRSPFHAGGAPPRVVEEVPRPPLLLSQILLRRNLLGPRQPPRPVLDFLTFHQVLLHPRVLRFRHLLPFCTENGS